MAGHRPRSSLRPPVPGLPMSAVRPAATRSRPIGVTMPGTRRRRRRCLVMRCSIAILAGLLLMAAPAFSAPNQEQDTAHDDQPRGERYDERWQGRHHWLYDDVEPGAATDGFAAKAQANCRHVVVQLKRSDGTTVVRRIRRCD